jgi:hypothetical protein
VYKNALHSKLSTLYVICDTLYENILRSSLLKPHFSVEYLTHSDLAENSADNPCIPAVFALDASMCKEYLNTP